MPGFRPDLPRCVAFRPKILQLLPLFESIHAGPEAMVGNGDQLAGGNQSLKGLVHQVLPGLHKIEDSFRKNEVPAVDPGVTGARMIDPRHMAGLVHFDQMKRLRRGNGDKARRLPGLEKVLDDAIYIDVTETVDVI